MLILYQSIKRAAQPFKNRIAVTKEVRPQQRRICAAIGKEKNDAMQMITF